VKRVIELLEKAGTSIMLATAGKPDSSDMELCTDAINYINDAMALLKTPRWETPVQYEKRTGKPYPNEGPVWELFVYLPYLPVCEWMLKEYRYANIGRRPVVCAYGSPEKPPDDWEPEEEN
jgi:hypothetical protein